MLRLFCSAQEPADSELYSFSEQIFTEDVRPGDHSIQAHSYAIWTHQIASEFLLEIEKARSEKCLNDLDIEVPLTRTT